MPEETGTTDPVEEEEDDKEEERRRRRSFDKMTKMMGGEAQEAAGLAAEKMHVREEGPRGSTIKAMEMAGVAKAEPKSNACTIL